MREEAVEEQHDVVIFQSGDGTIGLDVELKDETVWLSQKQMAELFDKNVKTINEHIGNIYKEAELLKEPTIRNFRTVQKEGARDVERDVARYNLDVIISVGYRVKSQRGTQFRIWATKILKEHIVTGYSINQKRLAQKGLDEAKEMLDIILNHIIKDRQKHPPAKRYGDTVDCKYVSGGVRCVELGMGSGASISWRRFVLSV